MSAKKLWTEAYRPKTLDDYVFQSEQQREQINKIVATGDLPHLLLTGTQGSGKTTLAEILISELDVVDADVLRINASDKTGVDFIRDSILTFAESYPLGHLKVIKLEEFDYMSQPAQGMLRAVFEDASDTCRFICTCNYENKIIPALKSRMQHLRFKAPNQNEVMGRMIEILIAESVEFDEEVLLKYVNQAYPDIRKIINNLQLNSVGGKLGNPTVDADGDDYQFKLMDLLTAGKLDELKKLVCEQCSNEQLVEVYEFMYRNLGLHPKLKPGTNGHDEALIILAEGVYKHGLVALPQLNFVATMIKLNGALK